MGSRVLLAGMRIAGARAMTRARSGPSSSSTSNRPGLVAAAGDGDARGVNERGRLDAALLPRARARRFERQRQSNGLERSIAAISRLTSAGASRPARCFADGRVVELDLFEEERAFARELSDSLRDTRLEQIAARAQQPAARRRTIRRRATAPPRASPARRGRRAPRRRAASCAAG